MGCAGNIRTRSQPRMGGTRSRNRNRTRTRYHSRKGAKCSIMKNLMYVV